MSKRHKEALFIQEGAGNLVAISKSLVSACEEAMEETNSTGAVWTDPAVRLIVRQMAYLADTHEIDTNTSVYTKLLAQCQEKE